MASSAGKRVVVVGGGTAGGLLAKTLQFQADVVLIDPKEYFEITWASLRAKVEPPVAERSTFKHSDYFTNGRIVISYAVGITETEVLTSDGQQIPYDYLVVASGHDDCVPRNRSERLEEYQTENEKIKSADSILIIGGGPTGVELAAEIAVDFPEKKVTLVHNKPRLLDFIGPKASRKTLDWLTSKKVEVILGQSVDLNSHSDGDRTYQTSGGETIEADRHFLCIGRPLSTSWIKESVLKNAVDARGRLMVDEHLRVKGCKNVFAIGDITDVPELKQGYLAQSHAMLTAKNLKLLMNGGKESKMAKYKPASEMAIVSLGRKEGVAQLPFATIIGCFPGMLKSKDLFVGKTRKQMGLK
ncbi:Pyridine nucleotide-disulfide oxidoreductase [Macleaya cordata]|uniref:Pyridine nucleotide-disulfide oxidoreductase n=1 Tax=Macleaya cordata TaxID=56857 RepID=A0A200Q9L3_MACCD|nr:Pyridine nucleotide-disulfide oxidoreductase [Macleaya cordata]